MEKVKNINNWQVRV